MRSSANTRPSGAGWVCGTVLRTHCPLIPLSERFKNVEHGRPILDHAFLFLKVFGFVLATFLVGALTLRSG